MAYPVRIEYPGACYHVINRGNYRRSLFEGQGAAEAFIRTLGEAAERFGWEIHAYVVMRNHFHLAVRIGEPNLSVGMQWLQSTWVRRYNGYRRVVGRPFQGRYKAILFEPGSAFAQVCHYIHLNPVRAKIVNAEQAARHQHGSLAWFPRKDRPRWLNSTTVLIHAGQLSDTLEGWRCYGDYLAFLAGDKAAQRDLASKRFSRGWCVGNKSFKAKIRGQIEGRVFESSGERFIGLEREIVQLERRALWEEALQKLARCAGIELGDLSKKKSAPLKVQLAAAMKETTSVSNGWLASRLNMGRPASVSQFVRRWLLSRHGRTVTEHLLSRVKP